jgi:hypothetical protein
VPSRQVKFTTELFVIGADDTDFRCSDGIIDVYGRFCYDCTSWDGTVPTPEDGRGRLSEVLGFLYNKGNEMQRASWQSGFCRHGNAGSPSPTPFLVADHQHVGDLLELCLANLEAQLFIAEITLDPDTRTS